MAVNAKIGLGATLSINTSPGTYLSTTTTTWGIISTSTPMTAIAEMLTINPDLTVGEAEVTPLESTGYREFVPTLVGATISGTLNWINMVTAGGPGGFGGATLLAASVARTVCGWKLVMPSQSAVTTDPDIYWFRGFITGLSPTIAKEEGMQASITIRIDDSRIVTQGSA